MVYTDISDLDTSPWLLLGFFIPEVFLQSSQSCISEWYLSCDHLTQAWEVWIGFWFLQGTRYPKQASSCNKKKGSSPCCVISMRVSSTTACLCLVMTYHGCCCSQNEEVSCTWRFINLCSTSTASSHAAGCLSVFYLTLEPLPTMFLPIDPSLTLLSDILDQQISWVEYGFQS